MISKEDYKNFNISYKIKNFELPITMNTFIIQKINSQKTN